MKAANTMEKIMRVMFKSEDPFMRPNGRVDAATRFLFPFTFLLRVALSPLAANDLLAP
jgi:hypothetical protein